MKIYCNNCGYLTPPDKQPKTKEEKDIWIEKNKQGMLMCPVCSSKEILITSSIPKKIKIGRNEPCPCGSGKKYKKCCLT